MAGSDPAEAMSLWLQDDHHGLCRGQHLFSNLPKSSKKRNANSRYLRLDKAIRDSIAIAFVSASRLLETAS